MKVRGYSQLQDGWGCTPTANQNRSRGLSYGAFCEGPRLSYTAI